MNECFNVCLFMLTINVYADNTIGICDACISHAGTFCIFISFADTCSINKWNKHNIKTIPTSSVWSFFNKHDYMILDTKDRTCFCLNVAEI